VFATGTLDGATANDALRICEQYDLEQHRGRISRNPGHIVAEPGVEVGQVNLVIEQMVQWCREKIAVAGLPRESAGWYRCVCSAPCTSLKFNFTFNLDILFRSRHDARKFRLFL
jgi:hypothetical protein